MVENGGVLTQTMENPDGDKDFTMDDLVLLKEMFLSLEKAVDEITVKNPIPGMGETFEGGYMFSLLEKANVGIDWTEHTISAHRTDHEHMFISRSINRISTLSSVCWTI